MNLTLRLNSTLAKLTLWNLKNPVPSRLLALALPVTFAFAAAHNLYHPMPACGSGGVGC